MKNQELEIDKWIEVDVFSGDFYAGTPSTFLRKLEKDVKSLKITGVFNHDVPCGSCNICCRSGYNIYVDSEETKRFPEAILDKEEDRLMLPFAEDGKTCIMLQLRFLLVRYLQEKFTISHNHFIF